MPDMNSIKDLFSGPCWFSTSEGESDDLYEKNLDIFTEAIKLAQNNVVSSKHSEAAFPDAQLSVGLGANFSPLKVNQILKDFVGRANVPISEEVSIFIAETASAFAESYSEQYVCIGTYTTWQDFVSRHGNFGKNEDSPLNQPISTKGAKEVIGEIGEVPAQLGKTQKQYLLVQRGRRSHKRFLHLHLAKSSTFWPT